MNSRLSAGLAVSALIGASSFLAPLSPAFSAPPKHHAPVCHAHHKKIVVKKAWNQKINHPAVTHEEDEWYKTESVSSVPPISSSLLTTEFEYSEPISAQAEVDGTEYKYDRYSPPVAEVDDYYYQTRTRTLIPGSPEVDGTAYQYQKSVTTPGQHHDAVYQDQYEQRTLVPAQPEVDGTEFQYQREVIYPPVDGTYVYTRMKRTETGSGPTGTWSDWSADPADTSRTYTVAQQEVYDYALDMYELVNSIFTLDGNNQVQYEWVLSSSIPAYPGGFDIFYYDGTATGSLNQSDAIWVPQGTEPVGTGWLSDNSQSYVETPAQDAYWSDWSDLIDGDAPADTDSVQYQQLPPVLVSAAYDDPDVTTTYYYDGTDEGSTDPSSAIYSDTDPGDDWTQYGDGQSYVITPAVPDSYTDWSDWSQVGPFDSEQTLPNNTDTEQYQFDPSSDVVAVSPAVAGYTTYWDGNSGSTNPDDAIWVKDVDTSTVPDGYEEYESQSYLISAAISAHTVYYLPGGGTSTTLTDANWTTDVLLPPWVVVNTQVLGGIGASAPATQTEYYVNGDLMDQTKPTNEPSDDHWTTDLGTKAGENSAGISGGWKWLASETVVDKKAYTTIKHHPAITKIVKCGFKKHKKEK